LDILDIDKISGKIYKATKEIIESSRELDFESKELSRGISKIFLM
jgi:hypothetical protein